MRDKLIEILYNGFYVSPKDDLNGTVQKAADYLIAHGVTVQTTPISYERLLELANNMHTWIFLNTGYEQKVYDELGITEEENYVFGYGGKIEVPLPEAPKEET